MNIGIDIDNVISCFDEELLKEFLEHDKELDNIGIVNNDVYITKGMFSWSHEETKSFYLANIERIAKKLKVKEDAKKYIDMLKKDECNIYIISGRDNGEYSNPYNMTKKWLADNLIYYDKLILTDAYKNDKHGKTEKCKQNNIDIMIDDSVNICRDLKENNINTLIMDTNYNKECSDIRRVHNWKEIYEVINEYK